MLCSRMLRVRPKHGRIYEILERGFSGLERSYARGLDVVLRHKLATLAVTTLVLAGMVVILVPRIGAEFASPEDMSAFMVTIETPVGTSLPAMDHKMQEIERIVLSQPEVRSAFSGVDIFERGQVNAGVIFCQLVKPAQREASQRAIVQRLR